MGLLMEDTVGLLRIRLELLGIGLGSLGLPWVTVAEERREGEPNELMPFLPCSRL